MFMNLLVLPFDETIMSIPLTNRNEYTHDRFITFKIQFIFQ